MPKIIEYHLTDEEVKVLDEAINHAKEPEVRQRATALKLLHRKGSREAVAEVMAVSSVTVGNWHHRWQTEGLAGLKNKARSGRPASADQSYRQRLEQIIETDPADYGYGFTFWTSGRLEAHLRQETGVALSERRFRALLAACGYVFRRPTHDLSGLQDPAAQQAAQDLLDWLKKTPVSRSPSSFSLWTKQP